MNKKRVIKGAGNFRSVDAGPSCSTTKVGPELCDWIHEMRRVHRDVGKQEVLSKVLQLKPDMSDGLPNSDKDGQMERFNHTFDKWYARFRKCNQFCLRRRTSGQSSQWAMGDWHVPP